VVRKKEEKTQTLSIYDCSRVVCAIVQSFFSVHTMSSSSYKSGKNEYEIQPKKKKKRNKKEQRGDDGDNSECGMGERLK
jgi:hypothetical protein